MKCSSYLYDIKIKVMYKGELEPNPIVDAIELLKINTDFDSIIKMCNSKIETSNDYFWFVGDYNTTKSYWKEFKEQVLNQNK
jgi:hypothetical protein